MRDSLERLRCYGDVAENVSMSTLTTLRIGGNARAIVYPKTMLALTQVLRLLAKQGIPFKIFGKGSNLLCSDNDYEGVIIKLDRYHDDFYFDGQTVVAEAGCSIIALSYEAMKHSLSGLEFASGIPGTVGGAAFMNAGAYKSCMAEVVSEVFVLREGRCEWLSPAECGFSYRTSIFQSHPDWVILAVRFHLTTQDQAEIRDLMDRRRQRRMESQPLDKPSAGSVFRNPKDRQAWQMIDELGYRGHRVGGVSVSEKHVNFIVNDQQGKARDFIELVEEIQDQVRRKYGEELILVVEKFNW